MLINRFASFVQNKSSFLYHNSYLLQNIDKLIFVSIVLTFISAIFVSSDIIGGLCCLTFLLTGIKFLTKEGEKFEFNKIEIILIAYLMLVLISTAGASLFILSLKGVIKTLTYFGFYLSCWQYFKTHKSDIIKIFAIICGCLAIESIVAIIQNYSKISAISGWQDISSLNPEQIMTRVYGTLKPYNPNLFCGYIISTIPAIYGLNLLFFLEKKKRLTITLTILSALSTIAIFLTGCRGGYIAWVAMATFIFGLTYKFISPSLKNLYLKISSVLFTLGVGLILSITALRARIMSIFAFRADSSNSFRFNVYQSCIEMFKDNWLLGIGVGNLNFREIYGLYMKSGFDALSAYNIFLETAIESGLFALLTFVFLLFTSIFEGIKFIFNQAITNRLSAITVGIAITSIIGLIVHGFVDTVFFRPQIQIVFWFMLATISIYTNKKFSN